MKNNFDNFRKILEIQKNFESNIICEYDIDIESKKNLIEMYDKQIKSLNQDIYEKQKKLNNLTEKVNNYYKLAIENSK